MGIKSTLSLWIVILLSALGQTLAEEKMEDNVDDPLAPILKPVLTSTVDVAIETYRKNAKYTDADFPMQASEFAGFREEIVSSLTETLGLGAWVVRNPAGKKSPIHQRFKDRLLKTIQHHGIEMEVHAVEFPETGLTVPMVICLPSEGGPRPGICVFSGHSKHGLRDLVLDLDSYQRGVAVRLAKAGFVTIAVEKIDTGYLSRDALTGVDEKEVASFGLMWGRVIRSDQLMACIAAGEILAAHPRVDETRIGATGVSLGGWLSVQTALLSDRIRAIADFGRKTVTIPEGMTAEEFRGMPDLCHILPGMMSLGDRHMLALAYCPRPMLAGHGRKDAGSHGEGPIHYRQLFQQQYETVDHPDRFKYLIHQEGDTMPDQAVIDYFRRQFQ